MKKILVSAFVVGVVFFGLSHPAQAKTINYRAVTTGFTLTYDDYYTLTPASILFGTEITPTTLTSRFKSQTITFGPVSLFKDVQVALKTGSAEKIGAAYIKLYDAVDKDVYTSESGTTVTKKDSLTTVNGFPAAHLIRTYTVKDFPDLDTQKEYYVFSPDGHRVFVLQSEYKLKNTRAPQALNEIRKSIVISDINRIWTNLKGKYSFKYPRYMAGLSLGTISVLADSSRDQSDGLTSSVTVMPMDNEIFVSEPNLKTALAKSWSAFITAYIAEAKTDSGTLSTALKLPQTSFVVGEPITYGMNGYTASRFSFDWKYSSTIKSGARNEFILVTKDMKTVYILLSQNLSTKKSTVIPDAFSKDFRLIAQSFRIL